MTFQFVPFGSGAYIVLLTILLVTKGLDVLSTWIATPNLRLEANPIFKRLGWKLSLLITIAYCVPVAMWPFAAIMISTINALVAARNFQNAWMMRTMGELNYSCFMREQITRSPRGLFQFCLVSQTFALFLVGSPLMLLTPYDSVIFPIGSGICGFALVQLAYVSFSVWRIRRA